MTRVTASPNRVEPPLIKELSDALYRIAGNYAREGTCTPDGRFEGRCLEAVQAEYVLNHYASLRPTDERGHPITEPLLALIRVRRLLRKAQREGDSIDPDALEEALRVSGLVTP